MLNEVVNFTFSGSSCDESFFCLAKSFYMLSPYIFIYIYILIRSRSLSLSLSLSLPLTLSLTHTHTHRHRHTHIILFCYNSSVLTTPLIHFLLSSYFLFSFLFVSSSRFIFIFFCFFVFCEVPIFFESSFILLIIFF